MRPMRRTRPRRPACRRPRAGCVPCAGCVPSRQPAGRCRTRGALDPCLPSRSRRRVIALSIDLSVPPVMWPQRGNAPRTSTPTGGCDIGALRASRSSVWLHGEAQRASGDGQRRCITIRSYINAIGGRDEPDRAQQAGSVAACPERRRRALLLRAGRNASLGTTREMAPPAESLLCQHRSCPSGPGHRPAGTRDDAERVIADGARATPVPLCPRAALLPDVAVCLAVLRNRDRATHDRRAAGDPSLAPHSGAAGPARRYILHTTCQGVG